MARPKKAVEIPGQESAQAQGVELSDTDGTALTERNNILSTLNERGAAIIARFEEYDFTDIVGHRLTDCLDFLSLVRKATDTTTASTGATVTNEEGKRQPVAGKPVLTEHGWHVPG